MIPVSLTTPDSPPAVVPSAPKSLHVAVSPAVTQILNEKFRFNLAVLLPPLSMALIRCSRRTRAFEHSDDQGNPVFDMAGFSTKLHSEVTNLLKEFNLDTIGLHCALHWAPESKLRCELQLNFDPSLNLTAEDFSEDRILH